jgi:hypothetical protein
MKFQFKKNAGPMGPDWNEVGPELLRALEDLSLELHKAVKLDVRKHYSLMVSDAQAQKAIRRAKEISGDTMADSTLDALSGDED